MTWRSVVLGTLAVIVVCGLTPLNDFVLTDTSLCAGFLPLIAVVIEFLLIVVFNSMLHRFAGRHALGSRELAVIGMMTLIACSIPNWGLMRFFIPTPVVGAFLGSTDPPLWGYIQAMKLPAWLFPTPIGDGSNYPSDPVVSWFYNRAPPGEAIPWSNWIKPLAAWGIFAAAMIATLVCVGRLVLDQWLINERLPFPLVQLHGALIEAPRPGKVLNDTLRSPLMWIGLAAVFCLHSLNGLADYLPSVPRVPMGYNFTGLVQDPPLFYLRPDIKAANLSFMVIGATYFIRSRVALSVWGIYLLVALIDVFKGFAGNEPNSQPWADAHIGACAAFIMGMLWVGRSHWKKILLNAVGAGGDSSYRVTFWVGILGIATMAVWLLLAGVQWWLGALVVMFIVAAHLVVSRVVAETGLPFFRSSISTSQIYTNFSPASFTTRDVYFANTFNLIGVVGTRDSAMTFTQMGVGVATQTDVPQRQRKAIGALILWTFVIGCIVAGAATLYCQYTYPTPMSRDAIPTRNNFGAYYVPKRDVYDAVNSFGGGRFPAKATNTWAYIGVGFGVTAVLEIGAKRFAGWPLLPVGFVASYGAFIGLAWFSIAVGWLAKALIVRFGGSRLFLAAKPIFVGMILGEALVSAAFLLLNAILVAKGYPSHKINFLLG